jgi:hypothetical protein
MAARSRGAQALIAVALVGVLGATVWFGRLAWEDSGSFALALFGLPLSCAAGALWAERAIPSRSASVLVAALGLVSLVWSVLTGLGIGGVFLLPSLLLLVAAMVSWVDRQRESAASLGG